MPIYLNRAQVYTTTTGTGTITLGSAVPGYQTFADAGAANAQTFSYVIEDTGNAWEIGTGTYSSTGPTLTRTLVQSSTGSLLNLSGSARVYVVQSAADITSLVFGDDLRTLVKYNFAEVGGVGVYETTGPASVYAASAAGHAWYYAASGSAGSPITFDYTMELDGNDGTLYLPGRLEAFPSSASQSSITIPPGTAPSSPLDGDLWTTSTGLYTRVNGTTVGPLAAATSPIAAIGYVIDGGGAAITAGLMPAPLRIPFACTIQSVTLLADATGSIVVDIWKDTLATFPPTVADSICGSAKPTLSSARTSENTTLTGWTTSIAAGDILMFNVDSASTVQTVTLILRVQKT